MHETGHAMHATHSYLSISLHALIPLEILGCAETSRDPCDTLYYTPATHSATDGMIWVQGGCMSKLLPDRHLHQVLTHIATRTATATQCIHLLPRRHLTHAHATTLQRITPHCNTHCNSNTLQQCAARSTLEPCHHTASHTATTTHCNCNTLQQLLPGLHLRQVFTLQHALQLLHTASATYCNKLLFDAHLH